MTAAVGSGCFLWDKERSGRYGKDRKGEAYAYERAPFPCRKGVI